MQQKASSFLAVRRQIPIARIYERLSAMSCPRCGHIVPKGSGQCQTGRLQWPSEAQSQCFTFSAVSQTEGPHTFGWQIMTDSWYFPDTFATAHKFYFPDCHVIFRNKNGRLILWHLFENFFCFVFKSYILFFAIPAWRSGRTRFLVMRMVCSHAFINRQVCNPHTSCPIRPSHFNVEMASSFRNAKIMIILETSKRCIYYCFRKESCMELRRWFRPRSEVLLRCRTLSALKKL